MPYEEVEKNFALKCAKKYCEENNYSYEKLLKLDYISLVGRGVFCDKADEEPQGLTNDRASQPKAILGVKSDGSILVSHLIDAYLR